MPENFLSLFLFLINKKIIPLFFIDDEKYILMNDFNNFQISIFGHTELISDNLFSEFAIMPHTIIRATSTNEPSIQYATNSIIKNLFHNQNEEFKKTGKQTFVIDYDSANIQFITNSQCIKNKLSQQIDFIQKNKNSNFPSLTVLPNYHGTKRKISNLILNIINEYANDRTTVIDLMSGSGVLTKQFAMNWNTIASDVQKYAQILAVSHGQGFSEKKALETIDFMKPKIDSNLQALKKKTEQIIEKENTFFQNQISENLIQEYIEFINSTPYYSSDISISGKYDWNPRQEVEKRKNYSSQFPFCLFTSYFSNSYFGFYQTLEIDSIRYAISEIHNENDRNFALGALIGTVSYFMQGFGGYCAQPKYKMKDISSKNIASILQQRSQSILFDFFTRVTNLGKHSEQTLYSLTSLDGPWQKALTHLKNEFGKNENVIVYFDPPYKREEYGRYYHLLETLTTYTYPDSIGIGRTPNKSKGERYFTEFSSRNIEAIENTIVAIIDEVISSNWTCVWSYSNQAVASISAIIKKIYSMYGEKINISAYTTPHSHSTMGKTKKHNVIEYLIVFSKK